MKRSVAVTIAFVLLAINNSFAGQLTVGDWDFMGLDCFPNFTPGWTFEAEAGAGITILGISANDVGGMMEYQVQYEGGGLLYCSLSNCDLGGTDGTDFTCIMPDDIFNHFLPEVVVAMPTTFCDYCGPDIDLSATFYNFSQVTIGYTDTWDLIINNVGGAALTVSGIDSDDAAFTTDFSAPLEIPPSGSTTVVVTFAPLAEQSYAGELTITSDDPNEGQVTVALDGEGALGLIALESFNHSGSLPPGWTIESHSAPRTIPWAPLQDAGDDWSIISSQSQFQAPFAEWLISPTYDLSNYMDIELSFWHDYAHNQSQAILRYSTTGGVSWRTLTTYSSSTSGQESIDISTWADEKANVRFLSIFSGDFLHSDAHWNLDDFSILGIVLPDPPPVFFNPYPYGQPEPAWSGSHLVSAGCTVTDSSGTVDAASLAMRVDHNGDGDYGDAGEEWQNLTGYQDDESIDIIEEITFSLDGVFHIEFQAMDTFGNGPVFSMSEEGITDDIVVRIDTTPPTASYLYPYGVTDNSVTLAFSPTTDLTFVRYEIYYSLDSLVDDSDQLWTDTDDPALGEITTYTTTVTGLNYGTPYWFGMRAVDEVGHGGDWSNIVYCLTEGTPLAAITDLSIEAVGNGLLTTWSEPTEDENGNTPVFIVGYDIHASMDQFFTPTTETKIATVTHNSFLHEVELSSDVFGFYRVVALGCGSTLPMLPGLLAP